MLVANNNASFTKKATGRITFTCNEGIKLMKQLQKLLKQEKDKPFG